jgi:hypothetical protein
MGLAELFADTDVIASPSSEMPEMWQRLLNAGAAEATRTIAALVGLSDGSDARKILSSADELGVLLPKRRRERKKRETWRLALSLRHDITMLFYPPRGEWLASHQSYPDAYWNLVRQIGVFRFTQDAGCLLWPQIVVAKAAEMAGILDGKHPLPFFSLETGDYDCWFDWTGFDTWQFDHETQKLSLYCSGGFAAWFERRFCFYYWLKRGHL